MIVFSNASSCLEEKNLYNMAKELEEVKVYVADITDSASEVTGSAHKPDMESLKSLLQDALAARHSLNFELVFNKEEADFVIHCEIIEFLWTEEDPIDMISGVGPLLMDAMMKESYARMTAKFSVFGNKHDRELWERTIKATVTEQEMSRPDSIYMINERMVEVFMRDCFSKHHGVER